MPETKNKLVVRSVRGEGASLVLNGQEMGGVVHVGGLSIQPDGTFGGWEITMKVSVDDLDVEIDGVAVSAIIEGAR